MCPSQLLAHLRSEKLNFRVEYQGINGPPKLIVQPKSLVAPRIRQWISEHKSGLVTSIVSSSMNTIHDWECGLPDVLLPFACLIECAKRGIVPNEPIPVPGFLLECPNDWILKSVNVISRMEHQESSEINQRRIGRAIVILQGLEDWMVDFMWENAL